MEDLVAELADICSRGEAPQELSEVATSLMEQRRQHLVRLHSIDRDKAYSAYQRIEDKGPFDKISNRDLNRAGKLVEVIEEFDTLVVAIAFLESRLTAMVAFCREEGWLDANARFSALPFPGRIEAGVVWLWLRHDATASGRRKKVSQDLFRCGDRWAERLDGKKDDDEFWTLLRFLPGYHSATGRLLLPVQKSETPDFVTVDVATGEEVGVEVGQSINPDERKLMRAFDEFADAVIERVRNLSVLIDYTGLPDLPGIWGAFGTVDRTGYAIARENDIAFVVDMIQRQAKSRRSTRWKHVELPSGAKFIVHILYGKRFEHARWMHSKDQYGWSGNGPELYAKTSLTAFVSDKVTRESVEGLPVPRKKPHTPYTILVANSADFLPGPNLNEVSALAAPDLPEGLTHYFQEVWLYRSDELARVFPLTDG